MGRHFLVGVSALVLALGGSAYLSIRSGGPEAATLSQAPAQPGSAVQAVVATAPAPLTERQTLDRYCVSCHNDKAPTAGLALNTVNPDEVAAAPDIWEKVVQKLRTGAMPPAGRPRPDAGSTVAWIAALESRLDRASLANPDPGRTTVHRLNREEYANAIEDILALKIDAASFFPADDSDHGFDNMADVLSVSPTLLERYVSAARQVSRLAIGDSAIKPVVETYEIDERLVQDEHNGDGLPFGSRGGAAVEHLFPLDGEYILKLRLRRTLYHYIRGVGRRQLIDVRVDGTRVALLTVGGGAQGEAPPSSHSGDILGDDTWEDYLHHADEKLEVRVPVKAGQRTVAVSFVKSNALPEWLLDPPQDMSTFNYAVDEMPNANAAIASVAIGGPYDAAGPGDTPSRRRILTCRPDGQANERACARQILTPLARLAYRRPVSTADVDTLLGFWEEGRKEAADRPFETGIQAALVRLLADPEFLFRIERDPAGAARDTSYRVSDLELASRLSFFLWSSVPDEELLREAAAGRLRDAAVLEGQVRRMLADRRSTRSLVENFAGQWLDLRHLHGVAPDPALFPTFTENLRHAMKEETERFIEDQIHEDRSIVDLLRADYTFVNEELARHYGLSGVYGSHFRKVSLAGTDRSGLLGHASVLTVTSYGNRTSPVLRGAWVLDKVLGAPPPPPPPNVPSLEDGTIGARPKSVRERLEQHRRNPVCATCHNVIDPMGFPLEQFDAIGRWRTTNEVNVWYAEGTPVDASGRLMDGTTFEGLEGLQGILLARQEDFARALTRKLLTYALGRGLGPSDQSVARRIAASSRSTDYRWSTLVTEIVKSVPFQMRRAQQ